MDSITRRMVARVCERIIKTVDGAPTRGGSKAWADDYAFGYVQSTYDELFDYDPTEAAEFAGAMLVDTAAHGMEHIRATLNRVQ